MSFNIYSQARADMLWERMLTIYGKEARNKYDEESRKNWAALMGDMTQDQFRNGLNRLNFTQRCPSVSQFLRLCREVGQDAAVSKPAPFILPPDDADTDRWDTAWQNRLLRFILDHGMSGDGRYWEREKLPTHLPADWKAHPCNAEMTEARVAAARAWASRCRTAYEIHVDEETGEVCHPVMDENAADSEAWRDKWWKEEMERASLECRQIWAKYISLEANDDKPDV